MFLSRLQPEWIDEATGYRLVIGPRWPRLEHFDDDRLIDLVGERVCKVLSAIGRMRPSLSGTTCAYMIGPSGPVAAGWSTPTIHRDQRLGFSASYLVDAAHAGLGLASLCAAAAFGLAYEVQDRLHGPARLAQAQAYLQTRRDNTSSVALAVRQGFREDDALSFKVTVNTAARGAEALDFIGMSQPANDYLLIASQLFMQRLVPAEAAPIRQPAPTTRKPAKASSFPIHSSVAQ